MELSVPYAMVWRWLMQSVYRYGSIPSGELLIVLTIVVLEQGGYNPTVTDLANITGLPKSSISRYVSDQMSKGFLDEYIDAEDRRRRRLRPSVAAVRELDENWNQAIRDIYKGVLENPLRPADGTVEDMIEYLRDTARSGQPPNGLPPGLKKI
jgi:DNA-binding MarR family transcriptional regulator